MLCRSAQVVEAQVQGDEVGPERQVARPRSMRPGEQSGGGQAAAVVSLPASASTPSTPVTAGQGRVLRRDGRTVALPDTHRLKLFGSELASCPDGAPVPSDFLLFLCTEVAVTSCLHSTCVCV